MKSFKKLLSSYLIMAVLVIGMASGVEAGFSQSELIELEKVDRAQDLQKIRKVLEIKMVKSRLEQLGFTQEEVRTKLEGLSDQQVHQLASKLDELKVGGSMVGVDSSSVLLAFLVIIVVVGIIILLVGLTVHAISNGSSPEKETAGMINSPAPG